MGATLVGISSDSLESHDRFAERECLPFTLLSDEHGLARRLYGVPRSFFGLLAGRSTFVIDRSRIIRGVYHSQFRVRRHARVALGVLESMRSSVAPATAH